MDNCFINTNLEKINGLSNKKVAKVRDIYTYKDTIVLVSTDRQSAFDRIIGAIPYKGNVLTQTSLWWFSKTKHIIDNHVIANPHPNVIISKKCKVLPVEFVVRGYLTGSTSTSIWSSYKKGIYNYCGNILPRNLKKSQKLPTNICTPTTKDDLHDELLSEKEILENNILTVDQWNFCKNKALELFSFGQKEAAKKGFILVDTKYEFGISNTGEIILIDEIHTQDSSRYWDLKSYDERFKKGQEPISYDKELLRLWFVKNCDPYNDKEIPSAPDELIKEMSNKYIDQYEKMTGLEFVKNPKEENINKEIVLKLKDYLKI